MPKRVLAIGVGGSGKAALTILKERLVETYGEVPDNVVLLSFDTDDLREVDQFAGVRLTKHFDERNRPPEFQPVVSPGGMTMDTVFADIRSGKTASYMYWLEHEKLDQLLSPAERDIRGGAQQRRPIGRTALFLRYANPISQAIIDAITLMYGQPEEAEDRSLTAEDIEKGKRLIFIVGSVAGGTGSGMIIDVANLVRHIVQSNQNWQSVSVSAIVVLPDAFKAYTQFMDDPTNLKPNSYAALREFNRFSMVHSNFLPYMIRYADTFQSITWSTNQPVDHFYLVDTASRSASQDFDLSGDPMRGVFPVIADFIMAHVDGSLGDALATLRANAGQHYDKSRGRLYSGFNVMTYIFPVNDVIDSFSYRFLRETVSRQFLPPKDKGQFAALKQSAQKEVEKVFVESKVFGHFNPAIIQKAIAVTRRVDPERPDMSWAGLFGLITFSESGFAEDYQFLQQSLEYLEYRLALTKDENYKSESFAEGAVRLQNFAEQFQDDYLGPLIDPDNPESRSGGEWDKILGRYRDALRVKFAEVLDAFLLDVLNRRDERNMLLPYRLPYAMATLQHMKKELVQFRKILGTLWREQDIETQIRQTREGLRDAIAWMQNTRNKTYLPPFLKEPREAQEAFRERFLELMRLLLHQRVYRTVIDVLNSLGAAEKDQSGQISIVDWALRELESWEATFKDVDRLLWERERIHEAHRDEKRRIKVRRYLTDKKFEEVLYRQKEHAPFVATRILGQVEGQKGLEWQRLDPHQPLDFKLVSTWGEEARGAEEIVRTWFAGVKNLFQVVRQNVTIAERLADQFPSHASFTNRVLMVDEPLLRYNPSLNERPMFPERYVSFNIGAARSENARKFLSSTLSILRDQGINVDDTAESVIACTVVEISRGVTLEAVESFQQCESEYRAKLYQGRESLHLFPEEQYATELERSIPTLGETENPLRALSPELVIALGDPLKVKSFVLACAYGLVYEAPYYDPDTGEESTELWLKLNEQREIPLSQSRIVRELDPTFSALTAAGQVARLYLNALQNYALKITQPPGYTPELVEHIKQDLARRGVDLRGIENPFSLAVRDVNMAINRVASELGPSAEEVPDSVQRQALNAQRRAQTLESFLDKWVTRFKESPDPRIKDMGTVMHLILGEEIRRLKQRADRR